MRETAASLPPASAWGKLRRACAAKRGTACRTVCSCRVTGVLSLVGHSADVAAMMQALLAVPTIRARLARLLGRPDLAPEEVQRLVALAALHDTGKVNRGFQRKPFEPRFGKVGHVGPLASFVEVGEDGSKELVARAFDAFAERAGLYHVWHLLQDTQGNLAPFRAIMAHHGAVPGSSAPDPMLWRDEDGYAPATEAARLIEAVRDWFPNAFEPVDPPWSAPFAHAFAGLLMLADWLASDETRFRFPEDSTPDGSARFEWSMERARSAVEGLALDPRAARDAARALAWDGRSLTGYADLRPSQETMLTLAPPSPDGRVCLIEDETGAGKTEAAVIHFLDLFRRGAVDGMYFALPTRAAAVQIHHRIKAMLRGLLGDSAPPVGLAVPGYLRDTDPAALPDDGKLWPDDAHRDTTWASARPKRYLAGWVMVGTIDQLLLGGLQVRHAQLRSAAMLRQLIVVDEVHASDVYMTTLLRNVLAQHRRAGGHVLLMSATLGSIARSGLFKLTSRSAKRPFADAVDPVRNPYPAVWISDQETPLEHQDAAAIARAKRACVTLEPAWDAPAVVAARARAAAERGARVLVIRNTVRLAIATQMALEAEAPALGLDLRAPDGTTVRSPHHARFAPEDRRLLDRVLEDAFGKKQRAESGLVAVATQTAEQSLDIDADLLITDLCPADVLLQRIGRLHRHRERERPTGFEAPTVVVVAPREEALTAALQGNGEVADPPLALGLVYPDLTGVLATRRELAGREVITIPEDNRHLVEAATHPDNLEALASELGGRWQAHWGHARGVRGAHAKAAANVCIDWDRPLQPLPAIDERIATRLGLNDRSLELPDGTIGPFGQPASRLVVPARWLGDVGEDAILEVNATSPGSLALTVGKRALVYDRLGLRPA